MADKNIQIKNLDGDLLFPKTKGAVVYNDNGEALGGVEAGAQVNKIETIKVDGVALNIVDKAVEITTPASVAYSIIAADAEDGYATSYQLAADGVGFGTKINIPKDMVVSGGELKIAEQADAPVAGLAVGDPYIELTIANNDGTKIYIPVKDLVDVYQSGDDFIVISGNTITFNEEALKDTFYTEAEVDAKLDEKANVADAATKAELAAEVAKLATTEAMTAALELKADKKATEDALALKAVKTEVDEALALKADKTYVDAELAKKANQTDLEATNATVANKADKATSLAGYGIVDAFTKDEVNASLALKADAATAATKTEVAAKADQTALEETNAAVATKANSADVYNKTEVDGFLSDKLTYDEIV